jgi:hypothetical protein
MRTRERPYQVRKHAKAARDLLRGILEWDPDAMERYHRVWIMVQPAGLQRCQHVIALEQGFKDWKDLLAQEGESTP